MSTPVEPDAGQPFDQAPGGTATYPRPLSKGLAVAALVLGIVAIVGCLIPILNIGSILLAIVGIILGVLALRAIKAGRAAGRGMALTGVILSVVSIVGAIVALAVFGAAVNSVNTSIQEAASSASSAAAVTPSAEDTATDSAPASATPTPSLEPSSAAPTPTAAADENADVKVNSCAPGVAGLLQGTVTVTNTSSGPQSYLITVSANGADGNRVAELNGAANAVAPGQSAQVKLIGSADNPPKQLTCVVANVTRLPA